MEKQQFDENLYNLLRALVHKFGNDIELSKEEFIEAQELSLNIIPQIQDGKIYLKTI